MSKEKQKNNCKFSSNVREEQGVFGYVAESAAKPHSYPYNPTVKPEDDIWFPGDNDALMGES